MVNSFDQVKVIACHVISEELLSIPASGVSYEFLDFNRHDFPGQLRLELQECIDREKGAKTILLGYGICSKGTIGLRSNAHRLVIPRVHDCISLLLGSHALYLQQFKQDPATYYMSPGWIEHGGSPLQEYEDYVRRYGEAKAELLCKVMYKHYNRLALVDTGVGNLQECREHCERVKGKFNMELTFLEGSNRLLQKLLRAGKADSEIIVIQPGEELTMDHFACIMEC